MSIPQGLGFREQGNLKEYVFKMIDEFCLNGRAGKQQLSHPELMAKALQPPQHA